ncbi:AIPR family protein [Arthrobacter sp. TMS1-12-1]
MPLTADQVIAKDNFAAYKASHYPKMSDDDAFERFAVGEVALRQYGLNPSQIKSGMVGAKHDGGIDSLHVFLNGQELVASDSIRLGRSRKALEGLQPGLMMDVIVVQAKHELNWDTNVFPKIESTLKEILQSNLTASNLRGIPLNDDVVEKALALQKLRERLSMLAPVMRFTVRYVTLASKVNLSDYEETKRRQLEEWLLTKLPSGSTAVVEYVSDADVVTQLRVSNDFTAKLIFMKAPVRVGPALVGLVKIEDYLRFLQRDGGTVIRDELFAVNVRDYAGDSISVNNAIAKTLSTNSPTEFWWLNNGITIIADKASDPVELEWVTTNPLIVNGLQTSHVIHAQALAKTVTKERLAQPVLVRLITESDPDVREAIIAGTNNQTAIASTQLHANEEKQRRIEEYLRTANWHYERRRYQYRGSSVAPARIRTVTDVAQATMAFRLLEPDTARARPGTLLGTKAGWNRVFDPDGSEEIYLKAVKVADAVDTYLASTAAKAIADDATNSRHYLVAAYALRSSGVKLLSDFDKIPVTSLKTSPSQTQLVELQKLLYAEVAKLDDGKIARDQIFKGAKLKVAFFTEILKLNAKK